eukprot:gene12406-biopygen3467
MLYGCYAEPHRHAARRGAGGEDLKEDVRLRAVPAHLLRRHRQVDAFEHGLGAPLRAQGGRWGMGIPVRARETSAQRSGQGRAGKATVAETPRLAPSRAATPAVACGFLARSRWSRMHTDTARKARTWARETNRLGLSTGPAPGGRRHSDKEQGTAALPKNRTASAGGASGGHGAAATSPVSPLLASQRYEIA